VLLPAIEGTGDGSPVPDRKDVDPPATIAGETASFVLVIVTATVVASACARAEVANGPVLQG
jgi:hypothetical protein